MKTWERVLYSIVRNTVVAFCRLFWRMRIDGVENIPATGAYILAPVHRSNIDTLVVAGVTTRRLRYMGKASLWKVKPAGRLFSALGAFPVNRGSADRDALRQCVEVVQAGEPLVIFPEGTRQSGPLIQPLFEGAAFVASRTGVPIIPVGIAGSEAAMPKGSKLVYPVKVRVVVGAPLDPPAPGPSGRAPRSAVHAVTEELSSRLQELFDTAQARNA
ncbi:MAG TPA: lysophospholipid acyltransferase family protein [Acidimicrobiales bacterium]|nr:lysophospholipid acyltransferase family protein [Acidimicrobiales bacterium]